MNNQICHRVRLAKRRPDAVVFTALTRATKFEAGYPLRRHVSVRECAAVILAFATLNELFNLHLESLHMRILQDMAFVDMQQMWLQLGRYWKANEALVELRDVIRKFRKFSETWREFHLSPQAHSPEFTIFCQRLIKAGRGLLENARLIEEALLLSVDFSQTEDGRMYHAMMKNQLAEHHIILMQILYHIPAVREAYFAMGIVQILPPEQPRSLSIGPLTCPVQGRCMVCWVDLTDLSPDYEHHDLLGRDYPAQLQASGPASVVEMSCCGQSLHNACLFRTIQNRAPARCSHCQQVIADVPFRRLYEWRGSDLARRANKIENWLRAERAEVLRLQHVRITRPSISPSISPKSEAPSSTARACIVM